MWRTRIQTVEPSLSEANSLSILFFENSTESMNATHVISIRIDVAMGTIPGGYSATHNAMATPLFL